MGATLNNDNVTLRSIINNTTARWHGSLLRSSKAFSGNRHRIFESCECRYNSCTRFFSLFFAALLIWTIFAFCLVATQVTALVFLRSTSALFCLQLHFSAVIFSARILALLLCGRIFGAQFFPLAVQPFTFAPALYFLRLLGCNCMNSLSASTFSACISVLYFCALLSALFFHSPSELYVLRSYFGAPVSWLLKWACF